MSREHASLTHLLMEFARLFTLKRKKKRPKMRAIESRSFWRRRSKITKKEKKKKEEEEEEENVISVEEHKSSCRSKMKKTETKENKGEDEGQETKTKERVVYLHQTSCRDLEDEVFEDDQSLQKDDSQIHSYAAYDDDDDEYISEGFAVSHRSSKSHPPKSYIPAITMEAERESLDGLHGSMSDRIMSDICSYGDTTFQSTSSAERSPQVHFDISDSLETRTLRSRFLRRKKKAPFTVKYTKVYGEADGAYKNDSCPRGLVFVCNFSEFDDNKYSKRAGSETDYENLMTLFQQMGYSPHHRRRRYCLTGYVTKEMFMKKLHMFAKEEKHRVLCSCVVILMSHGTGPRTFVTSDNHEVDLLDVYKIFDNLRCSVLHGKPKIFILQFCRSQEETPQEGPLVDVEALRQVVSDEVNRALIRRLNSLLRSKDAVTDGNHAAHLLRKIEEDCRKASLASLSSSRERLVPQQPGNTSKSSLHPPRDIHGSHRPGMAPMVLPSFRSSTQGVHSPGEDSRKAYSDHSAEEDSKKTSILFSSRAMHTTKRTGEDCKEVPIFSISRDIDTLQRTGEDRWRAYCAQVPEEDIKKTSILSSTREAHTLQKTEKDSWRAHGAQAPEEDSKEASILSTREAHTLHRTEKDGWRAHGTQAPEEVSKEASILSSRREAHTLQRTEDDSRTHGAQGPVEDSKGASILSSSRETYTLQGAEKDRWRAYGTQGPVEDIKGASILPLSQDTHASQDPGKEEEEVAQGNTSLILSKYEFDTRSLVVLPQAGFKCYSDMYSIFSTSQGQLSHRHPRKGSLLIQAICHVFAEYAYEDEIDTLVRRVSTYMSKTLQKDDPVTVPRQTCERTNNGLDKYFYFNPFELPQCRQFTI